MPSAVANGEPLMSAIPSFGCGSYGSTPAKASASAAGISLPSTTTMPSPVIVWKRWASGPISPAAP